jgi:hypothetical protein
MSRKGWRSVGDLLLCGDAMVRSADAVLRANGGRTVLLRMPAPAVAGNDAEQLGLATPEFQDAEMSPALFRKTESTTTLLVSASAVRSMVGSLRFDSAEILFETAAGVVIDGVLYTIVAGVASAWDGEPYNYCLTLRAPDR